MTREEAKQLLPIIQAFAEGKCVETKTGSGWISIENMSFAGKPKAYRIQPEPKYRPFANAEECWQELLKHKPFGWVKYADKYISISAIDSNNEYEIDFDDYTFADGTPFGVKVEE